jgi:hypothetical protein
MSNMDSIAVYAIDKDSIPDHYYMCDGYNYFYECRYNEFTFYIGTSTNRYKNELSFVESFLDEYNALKHCFAYPIWKTAENIQNY